MMAFFVLFDFFLSFGNLVLCVIKIDPSPYIYIYIANNSPRSYCKPTEKGVITKYIVMAAK